MAMGSISRLSVIIILIGLSFSSFAFAKNIGNATFNIPPYLPSSCFGYDDQGMMIAAASTDIWNDREACGQMYQVTCLAGTNEGVLQPCKDGSVIVQITDFCPPPGCMGTFDLSSEAFSVIADPDAGGIIISYQLLE